MVLAIGSMAVKAVFNGAGLLSGLAKTSDKFKDVSQRSKSTTTEMKRMRGGAHKLRNALAAIGVGGFTALMMTAPQLAGSLAKIKYEMQQLAWSVGKHLKPALDSVATILRGIRTGDWSIVIQGVKELGNSLLGLVSPVIDIIFGEGSAEKAKTDFDNWYSSLVTGIEEGDLGQIIKSIIWDPAAWVLENAYDWGATHLGPYFKDVLQGAYNEGKNFMDDLKSDRGIGDALRNLWGVGKIMQFAGYDRARQQKMEKMGYQTGGYVPQTGLYQLHAGETVTMKGSNGMSAASGASNITLDFSGANINLASGIELDEFANQISLKIAERQQSLTY